MFSYQYSLYSLFFRGNTLIKAYNEILQERGNGANWYKRNALNLENWEKGNTINGTTCAQFRRLVGELNWKIILQGKKPLGSIGRRVSKKSFFRITSRFLAPFTAMRGFEEFALHRITYILEKE